MKFLCLVMVLMVINVNILEFVLIEITMIMKVRIALYMLIEWKDQNVNKIKKINKTYCLVHMNL